MPVAAVPHIHTFQQRFRFCFKLRCHRLAVLQFVQNRVRKKLELRLLQDEQHLPLQLLWICLLYTSIGMWNRASTFGEAYWQALLFLEVMNIYDGVVIDKLWVCLLYTSRNRVGSRAPPVQPYQVF